MSLEQPGATAGLIDRVKNILLQPKSEWDKIDGEAVDISKLYGGYLAPLAAIAAIAGALGRMLFPIPVPLVGYIRYTPVDALIGGIVQFLMALVGAYVMALVINALAPTFGSRQDVGQAHKVSVYSATAGMLAGVFAIHPALAILGILGIYSLVLLYLGLPRLMKTPDDKRIGYFIAILVVIIVVWLVIGMILGAVMSAMGTQNAFAPSWG